MAYYRPILMTDPYRPADAQTLAGGWCWFTHAEKMERGKQSSRISVDEIPSDVLNRLTAARASIAGLDLTKPNIMGILNVTPDSFSDGGLYTDPVASRDHAFDMIKDGASIIDIGGESTRPGAVQVPNQVEAGRVGAAIGAIRESNDVPISVDTRKAGVAAGVGALHLDGPWMINDVSAATFDPLMPEIMALEGVPVCLMHSIGTPETMQDEPQYGDVLLDVYDYLAERIAAVVAAGVAPHNIVVDPGIGFGKTQEHNLTLLKNLSLFHGLGCGVLLGASRKRFIGTIGNAPEAQDRMPGSVAIALHGVRQGMQILRVHDTLATRQAMSLHMAVNLNE